MVLVKFCCVDGALVEVDSVILEGFKTIKNMFEFSIEDQVESLSCCTSGGDVIPLANVESKVFRLAIEWATKHYLVGDKNSCINKNFCECSLLIFSHSITKRKLLVKLLIKRREILS